MIYCTETPFAQVFCQFLDLFINKMDETLCYSPPESLKPTRIDVWKPWTGHIFMFIKGSFAYLAIGGLVSYSVLFTLGMTTGLSKVLLVYLLTMPSIMPKAYLEGVGNVVSVATLMSQDLIHRYF
jgi:hypothetical protein